MNINRIFNEPVALGAIVRLGILMLMSLDVLKLTEGQMLAVMGFVEAVIGFITRTFVTPNHLAESRVVDGRSPTNRDVSLSSLQEAK